MAMFGKKEKKATTKAPSKAPAKDASAKQPKTKQPKQRKPSKPSVPPDVYTLLLGLAALFFIAATVVLGLNFYWYQTADPAVVPMNWAR
jgi:hypothetical protein